MKKIKLTENLELSRIVHGYWKLKEWYTSNIELKKFITETIELGITSFDHADIYGNYDCETIFGNALKSNPSLRHKIQLISKCGLKLISEKQPQVKIKHYDYSSDHIISSVENSLKKLNTDYLDILLLHRPAPFFNPIEVADTFRILRKQGKVLHFGVSNFTPPQFELLNQYCDAPLITNQVEISPYCLEHFNNGNIDFFLQKNIKPMAWSPLGGGAIFNPSDPIGSRVLKTLTKVAKEIGTPHIDTIAYSWLLKHPASIIPVIGTGKIERLKRAVEAMDIEMSLEQWYEIYISVTGKDVP